MRQPNAKNCSSVSQSRQQHEDAAGKHEADRRAELRKHPVPRAFAGRRVLDREQHRAAPLAAETDALTETAQREQQRRADPDRRVRRQHADRHRRQAHRQQRRDQRRLAADAIAEVTEQRRADRAGEERDRERGERCQRRRGRIRLRKEQARKDQHRGGRVDVEIEELDRGADQAREQHLRRSVDRAACGCLDHRDDDIGSLTSEASSAAKGRTACPAFHTETASRIKERCVVREIGR